MQTLTDLYKYRFILTNLVSKDLKAMYRNMALGFLWSLLNPLVLVVVLSVVWTVFYPSGPGVSFAALVIVALIPYNFFTYCLTGCTGSIRNNVSLVKKIAFPRQILPFSVILTNLIHFAIQASLIVAVLIILPSPHPTLTWQLLWLPLLVALELGLCTGLGLLVAGLSVVYRDVQYIVDSTLTVLFWVCPILYSAGAESSLSGSPWIYRIFFLNPLSGILEGFRSVLYFGRAPDAYPLIVACVMTLVVGYIGVKSFWRHEREFADLL